MAMFSGAFSGMSVVVICCKLQMENYTCVDWLEGVAVITSDLL